MYKRTFTNGFLTSEDLPKVSIQIIPVYSYMGGNIFILNDIARVEQLLFLQADDRRRVQRLLWFQFEGYLEDNQHTYHYADMEEIQLGGLAFLQDAGLHDIDQDYLERPKSDSSHVVDYLRSKGFVYEGEQIYRRFVWLDPGKRHELMIIFAEDLSPTGFRIQELQKGGVAEGEWKALESALRIRALDSFKISSIEPY